MDRRLIGLVLSSGVLAWFAAPTAAWDIVDCAVNCPPCQNKCNFSEKITTVSVEGAVAASDAPAANAFLSVEPVPSTQPARTCEVGRLVAAQPNVLSHSGGTAGSGRGDPFMTGTQLTYGLPDNACFNDRWSALDIVYNCTDNVPTSGSADSLPVSSLDIAGIAASDLVALSDAQASAPGAGFRKVGNMRGAMTATDSAGPASTIAVLGSLGFIIMVIVIGRLRG